ncbi:MAG: PHB depolymerase family esterase [Verrucomicrobiota bacterium]
MHLFRILLLFAATSIFADEVHNVEVGDLERRYRVHLPANHNPETPTPVVIAFHGGGGNPESMVRLSGLNEKADEAGFIAVYPFGTGKMENQFLTFNGGECCGYAHQNEIDDVAFTRALLDDLAERVAVDERRIYATGLSNGGIMSYHVASELSDRIAAIAPVGGPMMTSSCNPSRPVPVMHFHGTADAFAPFEGGFGQRKNMEFRSVDFSIQSWVKANGCDAEPTVEQLPDAADDGMSATRKTWGGGRDGSEVVLIEIEGGGHTWPGKKPIVEFLGPSTLDISANDLMWEFFVKHPMPSAAADAGFRAAYSKNLRIHVGLLGQSDGEPLTEGDDFKPVWSKTGDKIVFFNRVVNHKNVGNWKTAIHVMNVDGTGLHALSDGTHTDFNQTWMRDGTNRPIWNRKKPHGGGYTVMVSEIGAKPGDEVAITGEDYHAWAYSCMTDGRIFVSARPPGEEFGYFLMRANPKGPSFARVSCELAKTGMLDRVSISPDETKVCFEFTKGFERKVPGRTLYVADFDAEERTITNAKPFANEEGKPVWFAYPRWTKDESAIMYHAGGKLFLYTLADGSTKQVSTDDDASYIYPHGEATPK